MALLSRGHQIFPAWRFDAYFELGEMWDRQNERQTLWAVMIDIDMAHLS